MSSMVVVRAQTANIPPPDANVTTDWLTWGDSREMQSNLVTRYISLSA